MRIRTHVLPNPSIPKRLVAALIVLLGLFAVLAMPVAGAQGAVGAQAKQRKMAKQIKMLKSTTAQLSRRLAALEGKSSPQPPSISIPPALPPSGPAGGDLTGTYPNPSIGPGAVDSGNIVDSSVTSQDLADGTITSDKIQASGIQSFNLSGGSVTAEKLAAGSVKGPALGQIQFVSSQVTSNSGATIRNQILSATCPPGSTLISGGYELASPFAGNVYIGQSAPDFFNPRKWTVQADFSGLNTLFVEAICLLP